MDVIPNWLGHDIWESKENDTAPQNVLEVENVAKLYETENFLCYLLFRKPRRSLFVFLSVRTWHKRSFLPI